MLVRYIACTFKKYYIIYLYKCLLEQVLIFIVEGFQIISSILVRLCQVIIQLDNQLVYKLILIFFNRNLMRLLIKDINLNNLISTFF